MYLRLGDSSINYSSSLDDFMIFSEIVDSGMSYERPILIRTPDELDIWFGKNFSDRKYMDELLENGITLYLYRPISVDDNIYEDDYLNLDDYETDLNLYESLDFLPKIGENSIIYKVVSDDGEYLDESTGLNYTHYIYYLGEYVKISELPQNLNKNNTLSLNNRDTLNINYIGYTGPEYCFPIYRENNNRELEDYSEEVNEEILLSHLPDLNRVLNKYDTLGFYLSFDENLNFKPEDDLGLETKYIILTRLDEKSFLSGEDDGYRKVLIWFEYENNVIPSIPSSYYDEQISIPIKDKTTEEIKKIFIETVLKETLKYNVELIENNLYKVYTSYSIPVTYFYNIPGLNFDPRIDITHNILSKISKNNTRIRFYSKTIGSDTSESVDCNITIKIEKLKGVDNYRITISRFDYYEVFEGGIFTIGGKRIDEMITSESKLVYCELVTTYIDNNGVEKSYKLNWSREDRNSELPTGLWSLRRATPESYNRDMYWKSVNSLLSNDDPIYIDFFLVPDINLYTSGVTKDSNYFPEYKTFLDISTKLGCQVLIQNSDIDKNWEEVNIDSLPDNPKEDVIYVLGNKYYIYINNNFIESSSKEELELFKNDFIHNYTEDLDNRLVYFFRPMIMYGNERPGYYLHILGLLLDIYSADSSRIIYDTPTKYPYEFENVEYYLEKYKSNYLVFNNQIYFYKKYQNGESFNTSIWMRFCIGKVFRELEKNKWKILGKKMLGDIKDSIQNILTKISGSFSFINSLNLVEIYPDFQNNRLGISIESRMSDLVDNDMTIDIVLNYNKTNND